MDGGDGDDTVLGGPGDDKIFETGLGNDKLLDGGPGNDYVNGGRGSDEGSTAAREPTRCSARSGAESIDGGRATTPRRRLERRPMFGRDGNDAMTGDANRDTLSRLGRQRLAGRRLGDDTNLGLVRGRRDHTGQARRPNSSTNLNQTPPHQTEHGRPTTTRAHARPTPAPRRHTHRSNRNPGHGRVCAPPHTHPPRPTHTRAQPIRARPNNNHPRARAQTKQRSPLTNRTDTPPPTDQKPTTAPTRPSALRSPLNSSTTPHQRLRQSSAASSRAMFCFVYTWLSFLLLDVELRSGNLLVFGGPSRRIYHGVPKVLEGTAPSGLGLPPGRLSITLRETGL